MLSTVRSLRHSPSFALLVILVLALGIGVNTAIFSVVNGVLLKPLPFKDAGRLVAIDATAQGQPDDIGYPDLADWRAQAKTVEQLSGYTTAAVTITGAGDATSVPVLLVTADLFPLLGATPSLGRTFIAADDTPGAERTAVISSSLWADRFSRDPAIVGRTIILDGDPFTIVGVMPPTFEFPIAAEDPPQIWMPVMTSPFFAQFATQRAATFLKGIGRLHTGETATTAQAELAAIEAALVAQYPRNGQRGVTVRSFQDALVKDYRLGLVVLFGAVAAVLLIACANIANLLLARGTARHREIAVRVALGATRGHIVRQLLAESVTLAVIGGSLGLFLAVWGVDALIRLSPLEIPRLHSVHVDPSVLAFTAVISILTGVVSGLVPAFQLSRSKPGDALKEGERGATSGRGARTRQVLVVAEVALSLVLLTAAGLLVRSLVSLGRVDPGFVSDRAVGMVILLPKTRYTNIPAFNTFYRRLRTELQTIPGVTASAVSTTLPMSGSDVGMGFKIEGRPDDAQHKTSAAFFGVSPEYFSAMGVPLKRGRAFTDRDSEQAPNVVIINEAMAAKYWPGDDPIGKRVAIGYNSTGPREIVGLVGNVKQGALDEAAVPQMYTPFPQAPWPFVAAVVRTERAPETVAAPLRAAVGRIDSQLAVAEIKRLDEYVARSVATPRFVTFLTGAFASLALLLAGFGLYGVMAYAVVQRRREIGIRMALGAEAGDVRAMVVGQALRMGLVGMAVGLVGALAVTRLLQGLLFNTGATDPATFASVCALLLGVMLVAAYLPALRATRVDPVVALKAQ